MRLGAASVACLAALALASTAQAAPRYAAPNGAGTACSPNVPCSLKEAVEQAKPSEEVIVTPGSYSLEQGVSPKGGSKGIDVHGVAGQPPPKIIGAVMGGLLAVGEGSLRYVDVVNTGPEYPVAVGCGTGGLIEQVRASASGPNAIAIYQGADCLVRDSLAVAGGSQSTGLFSQSYEGFKATARNLTAIATGTGSIGVNASTLIIAGAQSHALDLQNTIASGEGADIRATANDTYKVAVTIAVSNSNFDTVDVEPQASVGGPDNQTAPALFVDAADGDFREAAGSPTIDAGTNNQLGALDLDGNPRVLGSAPDIGAYELVPPPPSRGQIESLSLAPAKFRVVNAGEAIFSAKKKPKKPSAPIGTTVTYSLSAKAQTEFFVEKKVVGRKVKGKCTTRVAKANRKKKRCVVYRLNKSGFAHSGNAGQSTFKFSGRLGGIGLKPGAYRLVGTAGGVSKRAGFKIVK